MSAAEVLRDRLAGVIEDAVEEVMPDPTRSEVQRASLSAADAVLDMLREAGLLAEGFTEVVENHLCYPGCEPGCDIARTRQLVGPVEVIERRKPLTVLYRPDAATEPPSTLQGSGDTATQMAPSDDSAVERADHRCDSGWFDRTLCACGAMHSYCTTCGKRADDCDLELPQALAAARAGEAERHPSHYSTPGGHSGRREDCKVCPPAGEDCGHPNHDADKHDCRPFRAGEPERLSQLHADALATLDAVADRMDATAYDELHSVLEDGVLSDEDGRAMHAGRARTGEAVDREGLWPLLNAIEGERARGHIPEGAYDRIRRAALATRGDTTVRVSAERVQSAILTARWPDGSLIDSVTPRSTAIIAEFVMKAVTP